jgi:hypothetical protein
VNETYSNHKHSESIHRAAQYFDKEENGVKEELKGAMKGKNSGIRLHHRETQWESKKSRGG